MSNGSAEGRSKPWTVGLLAAAFALWGLALFRGVLDGRQILFSTDDNIGWVARFDPLFPAAFRGCWMDWSFLGLPMGPLPVVWTSLLTWLLPLKVYVNWIHGLDLVLAAFFLGLFLRGRGVSAPAAILGSLVFVGLGSNLTLAYAGHTPKFAVLFFAALALGGLSAAAASRRIGWPLLAGLGFGGMLAEQQDVGLFFSLVLGAYGLFLYAVHGCFRDRRKVALDAVAALSVALLLALPAVMRTYTTTVQPTGQGAEPSESREQKWEFCTQWSWPPEETIDFIAPGYMGWRSGEPAGPYWGRMGRSAGWERTGQGFQNFKLENQYLGAIPIAFALFAILAAVVGLRAERLPPATAANRAGPASRGSLSAKTRAAAAAAPPRAEQRPADNGTAPTRRAEMLFWAGACVVTLLLSFGKFFPLYALFYQLPLVNNIRNPNKFLQVFQLTLGILAAYGCDAALRLRNDRQPQSAENRNRPAETPPAPAKTP